MIKWIKLRYKRVYCRIFGHDEQPWASFTVCNRCDWEDPPQKIAGVHIGDAHGKPPKVVGGEEGLNRLAEKVRRRATELKENNE